MSFYQWRSTFSQPLLVHVNRITAWTRTAAGVAYRVVPTALKFPELCPISGDSTS
jgi:hypothetical protein